MYRLSALLFACAGLLLVLPLSPHPATAAWPTSPLVNLPVCTAASVQWRPTLAPDGGAPGGAGSGVIIAWMDYRNGDSDIYAQRISADGFPKWTADGVAICTATGYQSYPIIVPDGAGGAIITWTDGRLGEENNDIYAQRVSGEGVPQWTANGVPVCTANGVQAAPDLLPDGSGGALIAWHDERSVLLVTNDIYAQRISAAGVPQWTANGVALCTAIGNQGAPRIAPDGAGGAIVAWPDKRSGSGYGTSDIYAQRISAAGAVQWVANGVAVCSAVLDQSSPVIVSDGAGGAIIAWVDLRVEGYADIYAQRVSGAGAPLWTADGVSVVDATGTQSWLDMVSDDAGGAIVTWSDFRGGDHSDIYAQRMSGAGVAQWTADGVALCTATDDQSVPRIVSDGGAPGEGGSGAIVTWFDYRTDGQDIYAQRIGANGRPMWTANGVAVCTDSTNQAWPTIVSDGEAGAIITWEDGRGSAGSIYAQRVLSNGLLGGGAVDVPGDAPLAFALEPVWPNPARAGALTVRFSLPSTAAARLELLDVAGRRIAAREVGSLGPGRHALDLVEGRSLAPGLYLVCLRQGPNVRVARTVVLK